MTNKSDDQISPLSAKDAFTVSGILVISFYLLAFVIGLYISIIGIRNFGYNDDGWFADSSYANVFFFFLLAVLLLSVPIVFFRIKGYRIDSKDFGLVRPAFIMRWIYLYVVIFVSVIVGFIVSEYIPDFLKYNQGDDLIDINFGNAFIAFILAIILVGLIIPVAEELFRSIIFRGFETRFSFLVSALFSSIVFIFVDVPIRSIFYIFFSSLAYVYILYKSGTIWPSIGMHSCINILAVVCAYS
jgi:membrane protease YdiL (CAAX protease family)